MRSPPAFSTALSPSLPTLFQRPWLLWYEQDSQCAIQRPQQFQVEVFVLAQDI